MEKGGNMFGKILKSLRNDAEINQLDFARMFNVTQATISSWESERTSPSFDTLIAIADYFEVSIDYLIGRTDTDYTYIYTPDKSLQDLMLLIKDLNGNDRDMLKHLLAEYVRLKKPIDTPKQ